tara:strand:- start:11196 stop:11408 length:213 start_codon:yes stop_codon:yes gene_type:complete
MAKIISAIGKSSFTGSSSSYKRKAFFEGGHQLEKLEFALAISESKGDRNLSNSLRAQIDNLGGNKEEPGT